MQQIINEFESFMGKYGKFYNQFYVGIAKNIFDRLTSGHNIDSSIQCIWSNNPMPTNEIRTIEKYFLDKGASGGQGGGDNNTRYIYAYLIGPKTIQ
ncbi:MAG: hypothetical protein WC666_01965 [Candidatus Paceibacterota bacterium]|jgi:hypothetical protein